MYVSFKNPNYYLMRSFILPFMFNQLFKIQKSMSNVSILISKVFIFLLNSSLKEKLFSSPQKLKQDQILSQILDNIRNTHLELRKTQQMKNNTYQSKIQIMLLLDVKTEQLLLPYNKISVSFQLENPALLNKLQKFVARQQSPFNSKYIILQTYPQFYVAYGVISRIVSLNKLRYNVYQCILQGKSFCTIIQDSIQQGLSQMQEQYSYRICKVKEIIQNTNINCNQFNIFLNLFKQIKDNSILMKVYRQIDHKVFQLNNDPLAMIYSIIGILDVGDKQKYETVTEFKDESRMEMIRKITGKFLKKQEGSNNTLECIKDLSYNINGFLNVGKNSKSLYTVIIVGIILLLIIFTINTNDFGQL